MKNTNEYILFLENYIISSPPHCEHGTGSAGSDHCYCFIFRFAVVTIGDLIKYSKSFKKM